MWANRLDMGADRYWAVGTVSGSLPAATNRVSGGMWKACTARSSTIRRQAFITEKGARFSSSRKIRWGPEPGSITSASQSGG